MARAHDGEIAQLREKVESKGGRSAVRIPDLLRDLGYEQLDSKTGAEIERRLERGGLIASEDLTSPVRVSHVRIETAERAEAEEQRVKAAKEMSPTTTFWIGLGAIAGVVIGSFAPWATALFATKNGIDGDGALTLIGAIVAAIAYWRYRERGTTGWTILAASIGAVAALICIIDIADISSKETELLGEDVHVVKVGWGLWLCAAASIVLIGTSLMLRRETNQALEITS